MKSVHIVLDGKYRIAGVFASELAAQAYVSANTSFDFFMKEYEVHESYIEAVRADALAKLTATEKSALGL